MSRTCAALFDRIGRQHGRLHVLHNQVGMPGPAGIEVSEADWQRNLDVNVKSAFYGASLGYELLKRRRGQGLDHVHRLHVGADRVPVRARSTR